MWDDATQEHLIWLAAQKLPVREIARALGTTRNAVIGRSRRTGVRLWPPSPRVRVGLVTRKSRGGRDDVFRITAVSATLCGESIARAARRLKCSRMSIQAWRRNPEIVAKAGALANRIKARWTEVEEGRARMRALADAAERAAASRINEPILSRMPDRERLMMVARIAGARLSDIAEGHGVCRERIRQIEVKWRLEGLVVLGARALNMDAVERARQRRQEPRRVSAHAEVTELHIRPTGDPLSPYWRAKVEQALREFPVLPP